MPEKIGLDCSNARHLFDPRRFNPHHDALALRDPSRGHQLAKTVVLDHPLRLQKIANGGDDVVEIALALVWSDGLDLQLEGASNRPPGFLPIGDIPGFLKPDLIFLGPPSPTPAVLPEPISARRKGKAEINNRPPKFFYRFLDLDAGTRGEVGYAALLKLRGGRPVSFSGV